MTVVAMTDLDLAGKRVLVREDLNVPVADGKVTSDARIRAALPTLRAALEAGAAVMVMSHLGRPTEGEPEEKFSLAPVAARLGELLERHVPHEPRVRTVRSHHLGLLGIGVHAVPVRHRAHHRSGV